jgi:hypothetical protein
LIGKLVSSLKSENQPVIPDRFFLISVPPSGPVPNHTLPRDKGINDTRRVPNYKIKPINQTK